jgi:hypothetical protein
MKLCKFIQTMEEIMKIDVKKSLVKRIPSLPLAIAPSHSRWMYAQIGVGVIVQRGAIRSGGWKERTDE